MHRLDVGTSGLMVVAKSERAYTSLKRQFKERTVDKRYNALVQGHPDPMSGTIDAPIGRHPNHDYKWAVTAEGKPSVTHYDLMEAFRAASLLDIKLETGRTHQIRVHMSALKHPCVGDLTYGADPTLAKRLGLERQWLHAMRLGFEHPETGDYVTYESTYPADLAHALGHANRADRAWISSFLARPRERRLPREVSGNAQAPGSAARLHHRLRGHHRRRGQGHEGRQAGRHRGLRRRDLPLAECLRGDLRRYLAGEPILARPVGKLGRGWRWARRNRTVAGAWSRSPK